MDRSILGDSCSKTKWIALLANRKQPAYKLTLYNHNGDEFMYVVLVEVPVRFVFQDITAKWTDKQAAKFRKRFVRNIEKIWSNKYTLRRTGIMNVDETVRVEFDIKHEPDQQKAFWTVKCRAVTRGDTLRSEVAWKDAPWRDIDAGEADLDSQDFTEKVRPVPGSPKGEYRQRTAMHEFGHMLSLRDEYAHSELRTSESNKDWPDDHDSVMNKGESIRPRHYYLIAQQLGEMLTAEFAEFGMGEYEYYVEGRNGQPDVTSFKEAKL